MTNLSPRHVQLQEALRLGVESGWYSTKVSGTFVTGPHATREQCSSKIAELTQPPSKKKLQATRDSVVTVDVSEAQPKP